MPARRVPRSPSSNFANARYQWVPLSPVSAPPSPDGGTTISTPPPTAGGLTPVGTTQPVSPPDAQAVPPPGGSCDSRGCYDTYGNGRDANGNAISCDCQTIDPNEVTGPNIGDPGSGTCGDCSFQTGNVDWGSAGASLKYMPLHNGPAPRPGIAGGGGPKMGINRNGPGSLGNTRLISPTPTFNQPVGGVARAAITGGAAGLGTGGLTGAYLANRYVRQEAAELAVEATESGELADTVLAMVTALDAFSMAPVVGAITIGAPLMVVGAITGLAIYGSYELYEHYAQPAPQLKTD